MQSACREVQDEIVLILNEQSIVNTTNLNPVQLNQLFNDAVLRASKRSPPVHNNNMPVPPIQPNAPLHNQQQNIPYNNQQLVIPPHMPLPNQPRYNQGANMPFQQAPNNNANQHYGNIPTNSGSNGPVSSPIILTYADNTKNEKINTVANIESGTLTNECVANVLSKSGMGNKRNLRRKKAALNKIKRSKLHNNNPMAEVLQVPSTAGLKSSLKDNRTRKILPRQVSLDKFRYEVLFKEGWKTNELATKSIEKCHEIEPDKIPINYDFIALDTSFDENDMEYRLGLIAKAELELKKLYSFQNTDNHEDILVNQNTLFNTQREHRRFKNV
ncbi:unnamed protein product [Rotaria socialis]|uniref:Uncharacterized protein n=1 Tax=Rotaria socialis TaxID=392032 RepID=A0A818XTM6_9BILA|nr:unnamed protein product [Rotaria socialis]